MGHKGLNKHKHAPTLRARRARTKKSAADTASDDQGGPIDRNDTFSQETLQQERMIDPFPEKD
jgi:hypothetical protein